MPRLSLDTNVLIYAIDRTDMAKHRRANEIIRGAAMVDTVLTQQVIGEYLNVILKRAPGQNVALRESAERLSRAFPVLQTPPSLLLPAYDLAVRYGLQFWDSLIVGVCLSHGITHLLSEDMQDGQSVEKLTILNPFNPANRVALEGLFNEATGR